MKQLFIRNLLVAAITLMILIPCPMEAKKSRDKFANTEQLVELAKRYSGKKGFEVVNLGSFMMKMARIFSDGESEAIKDVKGVLVVDYEDAALSLRAEFSEKVADILSVTEPLMEIRDEGESVNIYGTPTDDGKITDFILFSPEEGALVVIKGSVSLDEGMDFAD